ncbi:MAG: HD domain-containing protein [Deltaproteobacteria bacterium]|nr:HD domain-containing protein [Deltaproteobacteria bacterium]
MGLPTESAGSRSRPVNDNSIINFSGDDPNSFTAKRLPDGKIEFTNVNGKSLIKVAECWLTEMCKSEEFCQKVKQRAKIDLTIAGAPQKYAQNFAVYILRHTDFVKLCSEKPLTIDENAKIDSHTILILPSAAQYVAFTHNNALISDRYVDVFNRVTKDKNSDTAQLLPSNTGEPTYAKFIVPKTIEECQERIEKLQTEMNDLLEQQRLAEQNGSATDLNTALLLRDKNQEWQKLMRYLPTFGLGIPADKEAIGDEEITAKFEEAQKPESDLTAAEKYWLNNTKVKNWNLELTRKTNNNYSIQKRLEHLGVPVEDVRRFIVTSEVTPELARVCEAAKCQPQKFHGIEQQNFQDAVKVALYLDNIARYRATLERKEVNAKIALAKTTQKDEVKKNTLIELNQELTRCNKRLASLNAIRKQVLITSNRYNRAWEASVAQSSRVHFKRAADLTAKAHQTNSDTEKQKLLARAEKEKKIANKQANALVTGYRYQADLAQKAGNTNAADSYHYKSADINFGAAAGEINYAANNQKPLKPEEVSNLNEAQIDLDAVSKKDAKFNQYSARLEQTRAWASESWLLANGYNDALNNNEQAALDNAQKEAVTDALKEAHDQGKSLTPAQVKLISQAAEMNAARKFIDDRRADKLSYLTTEQREEITKVLTTRVAANTKAFDYLDKALDQLSSPDEKISPKQQQLKVQVSAEWSKQASVVLLERGDLERHQKYDRKIEEREQIPFNLEGMTVAQLESEVDIARRNYAKAKTGNGSWLETDNYFRNIHIAACGLDIAEKKLEVAKLIEQGKLTPNAWREYNAIIKNNELEIAKIQTVQAKDVWWESDLDEKRIAQVNKREEAANSQAEQAVYDLDHPIEKTPVGKAKQIWSDTRVAVLNGAKTQVSATSTINKPDVADYIYNKLDKVRSWATNSIAISLDDKRTVLSSVNQTEYALDQHYQLEELTSTSYKSYLDSRVDQRRPTVLAYEKVNQTIESGIKTDEFIDMALMGPSAQLTYTLGGPVETNGPAQWFFDTNNARQQLNVNNGALNLQKAILVKDQDDSKQIDTKRDDLRLRREKLAKKMEQTAKAFDANIPTEVDQQNSQQVIDEAHGLSTKMHGRVSEVAAGVGLPITVQNELAVGSDKASKIVDANKKATASSNLEASAWRAYEQVYKTAANGCATIDEHGKIKLAYTFYDIINISHTAEKLHQTAQDDYAQVAKEEQTATLEFAKQQATSAKAITDKRRSFYDAWCEAFRKSIKTRATNAKQAVDEGQLDLDILSSESIHVLGKVLSAYQNEELLWDLNGQNSQAAYTKINHAKEDLLVGIGRLEAMYNAAVTKGGNAAGDAFIAMLLASVVKRDDEADFTSFHQAKEGINSLGLVQYTENKIADEQQIKDDEQRALDEIPYWTRVFGNDHIVVMGPSRGSLLAQTMIELRKDPYFTKVAQVGDWGDLGASAQMALSYQGMPFLMKLGAEEHQENIQFFQENMKAIMLTQEAFVLLGSIALPMAAPVAIGGEAAEVTTITTRIMALIERSNSLRTVLNLSNAAAKARVLTAVRFLVGVGQMYTVTKAQQVVVELLSPILGENSDALKIAASLMQFVQVGTTARIASASRGTMVKQFLTGAAIPGADFLIRNFIISRMRDPQKAEWANKLMDYAMLIAPSLQSEAMHAHAAKNQAKETISKLTPEQMAKMTAEGVLGKGQAAEVLQKQLESYFKLHDNNPYPSREEFENNFSAFTKSIETYNASLQDSKARIPFELVASIRGMQAADWAFSYAAKQNGIDLESKKITAADIDKIEQNAKDELKNLKPPIENSEIDTFVKLRLAPMYAKQLSELPKDKPMTANQELAAQKLVDMFVEAGSASGINALAGWSALAKQVGLHDQAAEVFALWATDRQYAKQLVNGAMSKDTKINTETMRDIQLAITKADNAKSTAELMAVYRGEKEIPAEYREALANEAACNFITDRFVTKLGEAEAATLNPEAKSTSDATKLRQTALAEFANEFVTLKLPDERRNAVVRNVMMRFASIAAKEGKTPAQCADIYRQTLNEVASKLNLAQQSAIENIVGDYGAIRFYVDYQQQLTKGEKYTQQDIAAILTKDYGVNADVAQIKAADLFKHLEQIDQASNQVAQTIKVNEALDNVTAAKAEPTNNKESSNLPATILIPASKGNKSKSQKFEPLAGYHIETISQDGKVKVFKFENGKYTSHTFDVSELVETNPKRVIGIKVKIDGIEYIVSEHDGVKFILKDNTGKEIILNAAELCANNKEAISAHFASVRTNSTKNGNDIGNGSQLPSFEITKLAKERLNKYVDKKELDKKFTSDEATKIKIEERYKKAIEFISQSDIQKSIDNVFMGMEKLPPQVRKSLREHIEYNALEQHFDNPEQYVSHGFDHSLNVMRQLEKALQNNPHIIRTMSEKYGLSDNESLMMMRLVAIYHDFGYPAVGNLGKALHAISGAEIAASPEFVAIMKKAISSKTAKFDELMFDFKNAILYHSADKVEVYRDAKIIMAHGEFIVNVDDIVHVYNTLVREKGDSKVQIYCNKETEVKIKEQLAKVTVNKNDGTKQNIKLENFEFLGEQAGHMTSEGKFKGRKADLAKKDDGILGIEYREVSIMSDPMNYMIRLADNLDMSATRFSEIQRSAAFQEIYRRFGPMAGQNPPTGWLLADLGRIEKAESKLSKQKDKLEKEQKELRSSQLSTKIKPDERKVITDRLAAIVVELKQLEISFKDNDRKWAEVIQKREYTQLVKDFKINTEGTQSKQSVVEDYKTKLIQDILTEPSYQSELKRFSAEQFLKIGMSANDESIRHFGGCESVKDVELRDAGEKLVITVDDKLFANLNATQVKEETRDNTGESREVSVGIGEYQIWRAYEAYRSLKNNEGKNTTITVVSTTGKVIIADFAKYFEAKNQ